MAYTRAKKIYSQEKMQFLDCEVLYLNEEDGLPNTLQREILLFCQDGESNYDTPLEYYEIDGYSESELYEQYEEEYDKE